MYTENEIERAALAIADARVSQAPVALPPDLPPLERADAYRVQTRVNQLVMPPDARIVGFKVSGMQKTPGSNVAPQLAIRPPLVAPLWSHEAHASGVALDGARRRTLGLETEICLRLGVSAKPGGQPSCEIIGALPAFEVVEQRVAPPIGKEQLNLLIADSVANAGVVLGEETPGWPQDILDGVASLWRNGELVMERRIGDRLEDPRAALGVLAAALADMGWTIPEGALLLTGLLTTELWLEPGDEGVGIIGPLGRVAASLPAG